ncbi:hypothetical protein SMD22_01840 (plasmid) [Brevibacillus halotolerans]|nr:hypothetical protein SMD22_01840 [Brevibacillus halotolerans]
MGLRVSHNAFEASYPAFNRFRKFVLTSIGGSYPPHKQEDLDGNRWYWDTDMPFSSETHSGLTEFLCHSDCDGEISPEMCKVVADELESILPYIEALEEKESATGQLLARGGYVQVTKDFMDGCKEAHLKNEPLEFL